VSSISWSTVSSLAGIARYLLPRCLESKRVTRHCRNSKATPSSNTNPRFWGLGREQLLRTRQNEEIPIFLKIEGLFAIRCRRDEVDESGAGSILEDTASVSWSEQSSAFDLNDQCTREMQDSAKSSPQPII
jgi:hypothetical protein